MRRELQKRVDLIADPRGPTSAAPRWSLSHFCHFSSSIEGTLAHGIIARNYCMLHVRQGEKNRSLPSSTARVPSARARRLNIAQVPFADSACKF